MPRLYSTYLFFRMHGAALLEFMANSVRFTGLIRRYYNITADVTDKVFVITGANRGPGKVIAAEMAKRGAKVIIGCRSLDKGNKAIADIVAANPDRSIRIQLFELDLASLESVRRFAGQVSDAESRVDVLINNAGIWEQPRAKTEDGFELHFGVNHLGHFLLTNLLLDRLKASPAARVVTLSNVAHIIAEIDFDDINQEKHFRPPDATALSKLANVLFNRELARRLSQTNIKTYAVHPGLYRDRILLSGASGAVWKTFTIDAEAGAQTTLYCALDEGLANETGGYYSNCRRVTCLTSNAIDDEAAAKLWKVSCEMTGIGEKDTALN